MAYASIPTRDAAVVPDVEPSDSNYALAQKLPRMKLGRSLLRWLGGLRTEVDSKPTRKGSLAYVQQAASLATTPIPMDVAGGIWRVSVTVRVTRASGATSAIQVTLSWTEGGVAQSENGTNLTANLTTTREGKTFVIRSDSQQPISVSTVYGSTGAPAMQYSLDVVAELIFPDEA